MGGGGGKKPYGNAAAWDRYHIGNRIARWFLSVQVIFRISCDVHVTI